MARVRLLPWLLGAVSHAFWLLALGAALATLLAMLATRRYDFVWETTILDPAFVERLALWLGSLPGMLGLPTPDAALIRASDGVASQPAEGRAVWAGWLLGVVVVYGVVPRALALLACVWKVRRGVKRLSVDMSLPGLDTLAARLQPAVRRTGVIDPAPAAEWVSAGKGTSDQASFGHGLSHADSTARLDQAGPNHAVDNNPSLHAQGEHAAAQVQSAHPTAHPTAHPAVLPGQTWVVSIELPDDLRAAQPPLAAVHDAGVINSGPQREAAIERLHTARPARLLVVCDARQTPDRGTVALVTELRSLAAESRILLAGSSTASASRRQAWVDRLALNESAAEVADSEAGAWAWLAGETLP